MTVRVDGKSCRAEIVVEQGTCFTLPIWCKAKDANGDEVAIDLTGWAARMQIRDRQNVTLLHELTTENGGIAIDGAEGKVTLSISDTDSDGFDWRSGRFDLELIDGSLCVTRLVEGTIRIAAQVTRP